MIRKVGILALVACLFLAFLSPGLVQAESGLTILDSSAEVEFPAKLSFNLSVESDVNVTDIRLHYTVDQISFARVTSEVYIEFVPAKSVDAEWTWDMRRTGGLPPGSTVEYWWTVEDASGDWLETAASQVQFDDIRYPWQSLTEGEVAVYWYEGGESFARAIMAAAHQAMARLAEDTGARLEEPAKLYIYASAEDLRGAMVYPQEWTGGVAFTEHSTVAIGIAPTDLAWGKRAIAHELAHLVVHQMTLNPYIGLPTWLDEGLAMYAEGSLELPLATYLGKAVAQNRLISVRSLSSPFSAYAEEALLAYAQSYSLVEFLISTYGRGKMLELLNTFRQGSGYDEALNKVYGFDMDGLDALWRDYVSAPARLIEEKRMHPALIGVLAALGVAVLLGIGLAIRRRVRSQSQ